MIGRKGIVARSLRGHPGGAPSLACSVAMMVTFGVALAEPGPPPPEAAATSDPAPLLLELNRMEELDEACRVTLLLENVGGPAYRTLEIELVAFDKDGIVSQRIAVDLAPVPAGKTLVRLFDLPDEGCGAVSRVLLNEVLECATPSGPELDCMSRLQPRSRSKVRFWK